MQSKSIRLLVLARQGLPAVMLAILLVVGNTHATGLYEKRLNSVNPIADQPVKGKVITQDGSVLPGVNVVVKGTRSGTTTDGFGNYSLSVPDGGNVVLVFSYIGYVTQEVALGNRTVLDISLEESTEILQEAVVTALGIKREERSLGYSIGKVEGKELTRVAQENVLNSMAGKVAGVSISSTGGTGSSVSMIIRGATSLSSDNQPLFVVDGVPIANTLNNVGQIGDRNIVDYGNAISSLNPEDIESVSILKGPSAAALYGSRAGNGVVLITTKGAGKDKKMTVNINSNTVFDRPYKFLKMQSKFGAGVVSLTPESPFTALLPIIDDAGYPGSGFGGELDKGWSAVQWNSPLDANGKRVPLPMVSHPDNVKNFLQTGVTTTNGVSVSNNTDLVSYRLSYSNMNNKGIIPNTDLHRNTINISSAIKVNSKIRVTTNLDLSRSNADNRPAGNRGANPLEAAYSLSANVNILDMKDYWIPGLEGLQQRNQDMAKPFDKRASDNPYFLAYEVLNGFKRDRAFGNIKADWQILPELTLMLRGALDTHREQRETKIGNGYSRERNGGYGLVNLYNFESNLDFLLTYKKSLGDFNFSVSGGGNTRYQEGSSVSNSTKNQGTGLITAGLYTLSNILPTNLVTNNYSFKRGINSIYGLANLGYKDMVYLDLTARNDWSSTLPLAKSYFYPSASLSVLASEIFSLTGGSLDLLKLRGGIAQVGNDASPYQLIGTLGNLESWGDVPRLTTQNVLLNPNLKPEIATSYEVGLDLNLYRNRLRFGATYYKLENRNQIFSTKMPPSSGTSLKNINSGLLVSKGIELTFGGTPVQTSDFRWDINANLTRNRTRIMELADDLPFYTLWEDAKGGAWTYVGDEIGDIYDAEVRTVTDKSSKYYGFPLLDNTGKWQDIPADKTKNKIGNFNPKFVLGAQTSLSYRGVTLSMTFDWRNGGDFVSQTYRRFEESGRSQLFLNKLINPNGMVGTELRDYLFENKERLVQINGNYFPLVGGPTEEYGTYPWTFPSPAISVPTGGVFVPGVYATGFDDQGNPTGYVENLGENIGKAGGTKTLPYAGATAWSFTRAFLYDASYLKLREVSLGYDIPGKLVKRAGMQNINVSVYSRNIILWTAAKIGIDPEMAFQPESGVQRSGSQFKQGIEQYNITPWVMPIGFRVGLTF